MKKHILYLLAFAALALGPMSCSKSEDAPAPTLASAPEADPAEDTKSGGVYKGALIGSSGTIKITLQKGVKEMEVTLDGVKKKLTTTALNSWTSGQEIVSAVFTNGDWSVTLSVTASGDDGGIAFNIPGHPNIMPVLTKELSTAQVKAYEGTYAGTDSGTWNFIEKSGTIYCVSRSTADPTNTATFFGTKTGNALTMEAIGGGVTAVGAINGNSCSGTWEESADVKGTWTGTRTL
jgi:hypothetical protein